MSAGGSRPRVLASLTVLAAVIAAVALLAAAPSGAAPARAATRTRHRPAAAPAVPQGFVGVDTDGPLFAPGTPIDFDDQVATMVASGVQSIRTAFSWAAAEPYQSWSDVPAGESSEFTDVAGMPVDFSATDAVVGAAARHRISVLPTVLYTPDWDAVDNPNGVATPAQYGPYGAYLTALIGRYGPHGSFWSENPGIPKMAIRSWQIWNEPDLSYYWKQPFASSYVRFLRVAHAAIKRADPGAQVVLGALTNLAWKALGQVYRVHGARGLFDAVAVNGFTKLPADVILYLRFMRDAMDRFKDRAKPLIATEISWPSAQGKTSSTYDFDTTEAGQARNIATLMPLLGSERVSLGLAAFYYYTWIGQEDPGTQAFNFSGLLGLHDGTVTVKPALRAFRTGALALEHCRRKGPVATACIR
jgi:polysaccharide biosynthesis protein PslG